MEPNLNIREDYILSKSNHLCHGHSIELNDKVFCVDNEKTQEMMDNLIEMDERELRRIAKAAEEKETKNYNQILQDVSDWGEQAALVDIIHHAEEYRTTKEKINTGNIWQHDDGKEWISNRVYAMYIFLNSSKEYLNDAEETVYYVAWEVQLNNPYGYNGLQSNILYHVPCKKFSSLEDAKSYIQGQKEKFSNLFTDLTPKVPKKYKDFFSLHGKLLPGFTIE